MMTLVALASLLTWLVQSTIKGSLMILLIVALNALIGRHVDARWRHLLWIIVLLRLALPAAPESRWSLFNLFPAGNHVVRPGETVTIERLPLPPGASAGGAAVISVQEAPHIVIAQWIAAIWLLGILLLALRTLVATLRTRRAVSAALERREHNDTLQRALEEGRQQLGIRQTVRIVECGAVRTPALHGVFRPVLLLPTGLAGSFSIEELRYVVLHELWHLRRMDVAVSWALSAVQTLHWFNPLVWFAASRIKEERELACDELALSCLEEDERLGYGRTILKLLESFRAAAPVPALVGIVNGKQKMKRRLTMIASFRNRARFSLLFLLLVAAVGAAALTDGEGVKHQMKMMRHGDPAALPTIEKLDQRVTLQTTNATFGELLAAVSNAAGVTVTQSPELATLPVQQARFTINAQNVPVHAVLMHALMPFELGAEPTATGVTVNKAESCMTAAHAGKLRHEFHSESEEGGEKKIERRVVVMSGQPGHAIETDDIEGPAGAATDAKTEGHRVTIRATMDPQSCTFDANGKLHQELKLSMDEDGVQSNGTLTIDIAK